MSMWQFMAALEGYIKANTPEKSEKLSEKDKDELWEMVQSYSG